ncbi:peptidyl-prolyl cis-trans isomerase FKBP16-3, chloroplastic isoform X2 [Coffea eugenioides]|uniref:peptidyl-prolyl cis-trans isomerase FKBP16-3, chloroplastic isoform X2 n=1 Tax=Coffea eugenioides TaxID=49369 RepID=UPI000F60A8F9|nr:peptidyl-prolyl cis-trans isomerase FKBP16-3, chloroplastic isoform X2 [Coffea eugenioides]
MASTSILLPSGPACITSFKTKQQTTTKSQMQGVTIRCSSSGLRVQDATASQCGKVCSINRRDVLGMAFGLSSILLFSFSSEAAGLPPEQKPRLCDDDCEKELENVAANYVAMVPSGQIFDSSLEKGQPYIFRVGSGQVIKGLDEGILSMRVGGKRRLYIPGSLAFPKGLNSAPGRPRVAAYSPVIFDVSLEYIPGLELEEE